MPFAKQILIFGVLPILSLVGLGGAAIADEAKSRVVFLVSKDPDNYEAHSTIPAFAKVLEQDHGFSTTVLQGSGVSDAFRFPNLEALNEADLLLVFVRRIALPGEQVAAIKEYLKRGKPLVGIRTANHAFSVKKGIADGHQAWWEFVPEVLGCENRGYGPAAQGTEVEMVSTAAGHPILKGISSESWHSSGSLYLVAPMIDKEATILLRGRAKNRDEPIAWTRTYQGSRIFYTSLGHPDDFQSARFRSLLVNGMKWAVSKDK